jgi:hypothetical protein
MRGSSFAFENRDVEKTIALTEVWFVMRCVRWQRIDEGQGRRRRLINGIQG